MPIVYATNNASRPPAEVAAHLTDLGLHVTGRDVATSSQAGRWPLAGLLARGAPCWPSAAPGCARRCEQPGFDAWCRPRPRGRADVDVAGVLQGYGADVTAADLAEAAYAVRGRRRLGGHQHRRHPADPPGMAPGNGTLVAAVAARDRAATRSWSGKPHAPLYLLCAQRLGREPAQVLAVGDRLDTDIAGAVAAGMDSVLVLTGVDSVTSLAAAPPARRPTYLLEDLRSLSEPYVAAETDYALVGVRWRPASNRRRRLGRGDARAAPIEAAPSRNAVPARGARPRRARSRRGAQTRSARSMRGSSVRGASDTPPLHRGGPPWLSNPCAVTCSSPAGWAR